MRACVAQAPHALLIAYCLIIQYYEYTPFDALIEVICI